MIQKFNAFDDSLPWRSSAYHVAARYKELESGAGLRIHYVEVEVGGRILPHAPKRTEFFFILDGEGSVSLDAEESPCHAGDCFLAPSDRVRGVVNKGTSPLRLLLIQPHDQSWGLLSAIPLLRRLVRD